MSRSYHTPQEYPSHGPLVEIANGLDDLLCGGDTLTFIAWSAIGGGAFGAVLLCLILWIGG